MLIGHLGFLRISGVLLRKNKAESDYLVSPWTHTPGGVVGGWGYQQHMHGHIGHYLAHPMKLF